VFCCVITPPPRASLLPYTTLFRSSGDWVGTLIVFWQYGQRTRRPANSSRTLSFFPHWSHANWKYIDLCSLWGEPRRPPASRFPRKPAWANGTSGESGGAAQPLANPGYSRTANWGKRAPHALMVMDVHAAPMAQARFSCAQGDSTPPKWVVRLPVKRQATPGG